MIAETAKLRVNEFHHRHGGECYLDGGFFWYEDGAYRDENPLGLLCEPPADSDQGEFELLQNKLRFFQAKRAVSVHKFETLRESLVFSLPADQDSALQQLESLRHEVEIRQEEVRQASNALDQSRIGRMRKGAMQAEQERKAELAEWRNKLKAVRI